MGNNNHTFLSALPLRFTIPGALVVSTVIVALWAYYHNVRVSESQVENDAVRSLSLEAAAVQRSLEYLCSKSATQQIQQELSEKQVEIELAFLADDNDRIIAAAHRPDIGRLLRDTLNERRVRAQGIELTDMLMNARTRRTGFVSLSPGGDRVISLHPVALGMAPDSLGPGRTGTLVLARDLAGQKAFARKKVAREVVGFVLPMAGIAALLFVLSHLVITRRVARLVDTARRFAAGDTQARANLGGRDELARVGGAFDEMAAQISASKRVLVESETARETLINLAAKLGASSNPRDAARTIFAAADQLWAWDAGVLDIYSPTDDTSQTVLGLDIIDGHRREVSAVDPPSEPSPRTRRILKQGAELILRQPPYAPSDATMFGDTARASASVMSVPVRWQGQSVGILSIQSYTPFAFNEEDLRVLQGLADECGGALQRIRDAETLRTSEERFRELASTIDDVFWVGDPTKNQVFYISPGYEKIWGRSCQSLYDEPRSWLEAIHVEDRERILQAATTRQVSSEYDEEYRIVRPDGEVRWIRDRAFPVRGPNGIVERIVGVARDVTERKALEEQIRQSQKLEAVGQLAAGIAHDFNNILAAVLGNTQLALSEKGLSPSAGECLAEIKTATVRARALIQQILAFSRQQPQERKVMPLGPLVHEVAGLLRASIPSGVEMSVTVDDGAPLVLADSTQMHQVLVNLCTNAWHALEDNPGRIEVKLQTATLDAAAARRLEGLKAGRYTRLSVRDTGKGMDANTLKHIFEPFFTTRQPGKGTGLGLSVVHGIVHDHEGVVTVSSQPGHGALFEVYLPEAGVAADRSLEPDSVPRRGQGQCILYLDDEKTLVHLATRMLNGLGYHVLGFTNSADALKAFGENPDRFDLVITDLNMPGASGLEVAGDFLKVRPDVPVVLTSGHVTEDLRQCASKAGIRNILYKPISVDEFSESIRRLLGNPEG